jgi:hypothetical protein
MKRRKMLISFPVLAAMLAALPTVTLAGEPEVHCGGAVCGGVPYSSGATSFSTTQGTTGACF